MFEQSGHLAIFDWSNRVGDDWGRVCGCCFLDCLTESRLDLRPVLWKWRDYCNGVSIPCSFLWLNKGNNISYWLGLNVLRAEGFPPDVHVSNAVQEYVPDHLIRVVHFTRDTSVAVWARFVKICLKLARLSLALHLCSEGTKRLIGILPHGRKFWPDHSKSYWEYRIGFKKLQVLQSGCVMWSQDAKGHSQGVHQCIPAAVLKRKHLRCQSQFWRRPNVSGMHSNPRMWSCTGSWDGWVLTRFGVQVTGAGFGLALRWECTFSIAAAQTQSTFNLEPTTSHRPRYNNHYCCRGSWISLPEEYTSQKCDKDQYMDKYLSIILCCNNKTKIRTIGIYYICTYHCQFDILHSWTRPKYSNDNLFRVVISLIHRPIKIVICKFWDKGFAAY